MSIGLTMWKRYGNQKQETKGEKNPTLQEYWYEKNNGPQELDFDDKSVWDVLGKGSDEEEDD